MAKLINNSLSAASPIKKVAVIGAGTMGAGIAGQVANAGVEVWLLDPVSYTHLTLPTSDLV